MAENETINGEHFYVYIYRDPLDETPVYVGKGQGSRAISHTRNAARTNNRLKKMLSNRSSAGLIMQPEIVAICTEANALLIEQALISYYGRAELNEGPLFNSTNGGDGVSNPSSTVREKQRRAQETRWGTAAIEFVNAFSGEKFKGKPAELADKLNINQRQVQKIFNDENVHSVHGWCLKGNEHLVNAYNHKYDFLNAHTQEEFRGTISQLSKHSGRSGSGIAMMVNEKIRHAAGWTIKGRENKLRPLVVTSIGNVEEIKFPWENSKAKFDSALAWAFAAKMYDFWKKNMDQNKSVGGRGVLRQMKLEYPKKIYLYERAFQRFRDEEFDPYENEYFLDFFDHFICKYPEYHWLEYRQKENV